MVHRDYDLRSRSIAAIGPLPRPPRPMSYTPAQLAKNRTLSGISKKFPFRRTMHHISSRGLERRGNECYRLAALQCLLHLPRAMNWFLQHHVVQHDTNGNPRVVNPCKMSKRDGESGELVDSKNNCMACAVKALVPRYWDRKSKTDNGKKEKVKPIQPGPLKSDDPALEGISAISATEPRFAPVEATSKGGSPMRIDPQCDTEEWMTYCLNQCRDSCHNTDWAASYRALFQFEFEERRFCSICDTPIPRGSSIDDPPRSFKQPSMGFNNCPIDRDSPGTVADAITAQMVEVPTDGAGITRDCPKCGPKQLLTRRFRIDAAPEYMLVKFNSTYDAAPPRIPGSRFPPVPDMRKVTNKNELPRIDERLDLTNCQVDNSTKLEYKLVAVLPHTGGYGRGHWIATVRNHPKWYNINDDHANPVPLSFALSNPEIVRMDGNHSKEKKSIESIEFQVAVLMYARV